MKDETNYKHYTEQALKSLDFSKWNSNPESMQIEYEDGAENFTTYFNQHYKPLLNKLADNPYQKIELSDDDKRLLRFLRDDLTTIFKEN